MQTKNFGDKLSAYRQNKKMTQEEFSARLGVTPQAVSKWERGLGLPDICILSDICRILNVSADDMLQTGYTLISEDGSQKKQEEILHNLDISDALSIHIGYGLVSVVSEGLKTDIIHKKRLQLAGDGFLLPVVHIKDRADLQTNEFEILSYQRVLYHGKLEPINEHSFASMADKLEDIVHDCRNYSYILNRDMVKIIVDHASMLYPVLISETIPSRISYGYLTNVLKGLLLNGTSICNLNKIIEVMDNYLSDKLPLSDIIEKIEQEIC